MKPKEQGYVLSIDQASNAAGVSLWLNGVLVDTTVLKSRSASDSFGKRLATQVEQLTEWLAGQLNQESQIRTVLFEGVRSRLVLCTVGAFVSCPYLQECKIHPKFSFIESSSWKNWAKKNGATADKMAEIKGVESLKETGFDTSGIDSQDIADSIMIYLCWASK